MSLIALLDANTLWGRHFSQPTWKVPESINKTSKQVGFCWASNPQDRTMHTYKSCSPEQLLKLQQRLLPAHIPISLQTDEAVAHHRLGLEPARPEWSDTLERIGQCCAVLSVDTAVAHLSAGSGRPTTMLLGAPPDWRWRPVPEDPHAPLWYPSLSVDPIALKTGVHHGPASAGALPKCGDG